MSRFTTRLTVTVVASGALLAAAALPAAAADHGRSSSRSSVQLGQIQYDSPGPDNRSTRSLNAEWVTVTNTARSAVNLSGWTLSDSDRNTYRFDHLRLGGRQSVRVHTGVGNDTSRDLYQDRRNYIWDNSDTATLRDNRGRSVDSVSWGRDRDRNDNRNDNRGRADQGRYDNDRRDGDNRGNGNRGNGNRGDRDNRGNGNRGGGR